MRSRSSALLPGPADSAAAVPTTSASASAGFTGWAPDAEACSRSASSRATSCARSSASARAPSSCDGVRTGVSPEISSPAARKASTRRWAVLGAQSSAPSGVGAGSSGSGQPAVATTSTATLSTANSSKAMSASRSARTSSASAASWSSAPATRTAATMQRRRAAGWGPPSCSATVRPGAQEGGLPVWFQLALRTIASAATAA
mmetsp:Transcript_21170/g.53306  ORF Transcript_21170/g.53306 Transcript_21170/m.53306 type:complete len:203 (+) Transcript_21170:367-975(+)